MAWDDKPAECEWEWKRYGRYGRWEEECESPSGAERRIDGLKNSVETFMDILDGYVGPQAVTGKRVLRTGMIPYDDEIINTREVDMKWGTLSDNEMPSSGTQKRTPAFGEAGIVQAVTLVIVLEPMKLAALGQVNAITTTGKKVN